MSDRSRRLDAAHRRADDALEPEPTHDVYGKPLVLDRLTIAVCGPFDMTATEYAEMVERQQAKECDADAEGLTVTVRFEPWCPAPPDPSTTPPS